MSSDWWVEVVERDRLDQQKRLNETAGALCKHNNGPDCEECNP